MDVLARKLSSIRNRTIIDIVTKPYSGDNDLTESLVVYMLIPKSAEYAIRCMAHIALLPQETNVRAEDLHHVIQVPREYLSKILRKLSREGLLTATRGKSGGFVLARAPSKVTFLSILKAVGYSFDPDHCAYGWGNCNSSAPCPLHETFSKLNKQFYNWATTTTLADANRTKELLARISTKLPASSKK